MPAVGWSVNETQEPTDDATACGAEQRSTRQVGVVADLKMNFRIRMSFSEICTDLRNTGQLFSLQVPVLPHDMNFSWK